MTHMEKLFFNWTEATCIPDPDGWAGAYAGSSNGVLLIAGGSKFPGEQRPWNQGVKHWTDKIFALQHRDSAWQQVGLLPQSMGYGVSLAYGNNILCIGGGNGEQCYAGVFMLCYDRQALIREDLPALPVPLMNACGAIAGHIVYVFGGIDHPSATTTKGLCWTMDLSLPAAQRAWHQVPAFPGHSRMLAMAGVQDDHFYVFGGVHLAGEQGTAGTPRQYLRDAWKYVPGAGWRQIADLPHPLAAAPSPVYAGSRSQLLIFGGDDGTHAGSMTVLKDEHPGFRQEVLAYHIHIDTWSVKENMPVNIKPDAGIHPHNSVYAPVTTPMVLWNGDVVIPCGEARPAVRSRRILMASGNYSK